jgi:hypothetical protein
MISIVGVHSRSRELLWVSSKTHVRLFSKKQWRSQDWQLGGLVLLLSSFSLSLHYFLHHFPKSSYLCPLILMVFLRGGGGGGARAPLAPLVDSPLVRRDGSTALAEVLRQFCRR